MKFEYRVDGRLYEGDNALTRLGDDEATLDALIRREDGVRKIEVSYDPEDPERAVISRDVDLLVPTAILAFTLFAFFGGAHAVYLDRKRTKREPLRRERETMKDEEE